MMKRLLKMKGYEVLIADNGKLALSSFENQSFDLIIMVGVYFINWHRFFLLIPHWPSRIFKCP